MTRTLDLVLLLATQQLTLLLQCSVVSVGLVIDGNDGAEEGGGESFSIGSTSVRILHSATIPSKDENTGEAQIVNDE